MDDGFIIEVIVNKVVYGFEAQLVEVGYIHKVMVVINNINVIYEPDEERNYRAIITDKDIPLVRQTDIELIQAVGNAIELARQSWLGH